MDYHYELRENYNNLTIKEKLLEHLVGTEFKDKDITLALDTTLLDRPGTFIIQRKAEKGHDKNFVIHSNSFVPDLLKILQLSENKIYVLVKQDSKLVKLKIDVHFFNNLIKNATIKNGIIISDIPECAIKNDTLFKW